MAKENLVKMALAPRPHGIKGEVELVLLNPQQEESVLRAGMKVWVFPSHPKSDLVPQGEEWVLQQLRGGNKVIGKFQHIQDRTQLEHYLPFELYVSREDFPPLPEGEFYLVDILGFPVYSPQGVRLGMLKDFSDNGAQTLFEVRLESGEMITLPYVPSFFPEVNLSQKRLVMVMPEYTE